MNLIESSEARSLTHPSASLPSSSQDTTSLSQRQQPGLARLDHKDSHYDSSSKKSEISVSPKRRTSVSRRVEHRTGNGQSSQINDHSNLNGLDLLSTIAANGDDYRKHPSGSAHAESEKTTMPKPLDQTANVTGDKSDKPTQETPDILEATSKVRKTPKPKRRFKKFVEISQEISDADMEPATVPENQMVDGTLSERATAPPTEVSKTTPSTGKVAEETTTESTLVTSLRPLFDDDDSDLTTLSSGESDHGKLNKKKGSKNSAKSAQSRENGGNAEPSSKNAKQVQSSRLEESVDELATSSPERQEERIQSSSQEPQSQTKSSPSGDYIVHEVEEQPQAPIDLDDGFLRRSVRERKANVRLLDKLQSEANVRKVSNSKRSRQRSQSHDSKQADDHAQSPFTRAPESADMFDPPDWFSPERPRRAASGLAQEKIDQSVKRYGPIRADSSRSVRSLTAEFYDIEQQDHDQAHHDEVDATPNDRRVSNNQRNHAEDRQSQDSCEVEVRRGHDSQVASPEPSSSRTILSQRVQGSVQPLTSQRSKRKRIAVRLKDEESHDSSDVSDDASEAAGKKKRKHMDTEGAAARRLIKQMTIDRGEFCILSMRVAMGLTPYICCLS